MLKKISILIIVFCLIVIFSGNKHINNFFITPIVKLILNFQEGNFQENKFLKKHGIYLNIKKHTWNYKVVNKDDRTIIYFTGPLIDSEKNKFIEADMHIMTNKLDRSTFLKLSQANIGNCQVRTDEIRTINGHKVNYTLCTKENMTFVHFDIWNKNIMITVYPYSSHNKDIIFDLIQGINIEA